MSGGQKHIMPYPGSGATINVCNIGVSGLWYGRAVGDLGGTDMFIRLATSEGQPRQCQNCQVVRLKDRHGHGSLFKCVLIPKRIHSDIPEMDLLQGSAIQVGSEMA